MYVCMLSWIISISSMSWIVLSTCLPTLSYHDLPCPALSWIALFVLYIFFSCLVLSCLWPCLVLHCLVLSWIGVVLRVALSCLFLPCLVLPCLALLVTDLVSSPESACLSALPCRVLGLALPCLVCYLDLVLSCAILRGLAWPCLVFSAGRDT